MSIPGATNCQRDGLLFVDVDDDPFSPIPLRDVRNVRDVADVLSTLENTRVRARVRVHAWSYQKGSATFRIVLHVFSFQ